MKKSVRKMNKQPYCGMDFGSGPSETAFLKEKIDCKHAHGRARVISCEGCVIAWWEAGENETTPSIKASAVDHGADHWTVRCLIDGGDGLYSEMELWGGSTRKARAICRALVASLRGVLGCHVRKRINKGMLLAAPPPLSPEEELADTIARQKELDV